MNKKNILKNVLLVLKIWILIALIVGTVFGAITKVEYKITPSEMTILVKIEEYTQSNVLVKNRRNSPQTIHISVKGNLTDLIKINDNKMTLEGNEERAIPLIFFGSEIGSYSGELIIAGDINERIPVELKVVDLKDVRVESMSMEIEPVKTNFYLEEPLRFKIDLQNLLKNEVYNISLHYTIKKITSKRGEENESFLS